MLFFSLFNVHFISKNLLFAQVSSMSDDFEHQTCTEKGDSNKFANMLSQWRATGQTNDPCSKASAKRKTAPLDEILSRNFKLQKIHEYLSQDTIPQEVELFSSYKSESDDSDDADKNDKERMIANSSTTNSDTAVKSVETPKNQSNLPDGGYRIDCKVKAIDTPNRTLKSSVYTISEKHTPNTPLAFNDDDIGADNTQAECSLNLDEKHENSCSGSAEQKQIDDKFEDGKKGGRTLLMDNEADDPSTSFSQPKKITTVSTSIAEIKRLMERDAEWKEKLGEETRKNRLKFKAKIDPKLNKSAEKELETEITKSDFVRMDLIGQFNLGFIIVRLDQGKCVNSKTFSGCKVEQTQNFISNFFDFFEYS